MNKNILCFSALIIVTFIQLNLYLSNYDINDEVVEVFKEEKTFMTLKELDEELNKGGELKIISQEKYGERWRCLVSLSGSALEIIEQLSNFDQFHIMHYSIEGIDENYLVNLEMTR